jgi:hypothetical protein
MSGPQPQGMIAETRARRSHRHTIVETNVLVNTEGGPDGTIVETKVWPSLTERLPKQKPGEARITRLSKQTFWATPRVGLTGLLSKQKSGRASRNDCRNKSLAKLEAHDCRNKRFGQHRGWACRDYCRNRSLAEQHCVDTIKSNRDAIPLPPNLNASQRRFWRLYITVICLHSFLNIFTYCYHLSGR